MGRSMGPIGAGCRSLSPVVVAEQTLLYVAVVGGVCARLAGATMTLEMAALAATAALSGALAMVCSPLCIARDNQRPHADEGLLFGCCALPCLWGSMAFHAGSDCRAPLLVQFWLSLCGALTILGALAMRRGARWVAPLGFSVLAAAGLAAVRLREELLHGVAFAGVCYLLFEAAFEFLPRCFTLGEAAFSAQGLASVVHAALCTLLSTADQHAWLPTPPPSWSAGSVAMELLAVLCLSTLVTLGLLWSARLWLQTVRGGGGNRKGHVHKGMAGDIDPTRLGCGLTFAVVVIYAPLVFRTLAGTATDAAAAWERLRGISAAEDMFCASISLYWLALMGTIPAIPRIQAWLKLPQIAARKLFHALALLLFVPVIAWNEIEFLALSLAVAVNAFVVSEVLRIFRVPPFGAHLQRFMEPFIDRRDQGVAVLTHVYLLLGCAIPIWCDVVLRSVSNENKQPRPALRPTMLPFSGLLSIGVLDSLAAVAGKRYGRMKWPGTRKTVEGTLCAVAGALAIAHTVNSYVCGGQAHWFEIGVPIVIVALLEACTQQIDNLVLPVVYAILVLVIKS